MTESPEVFEPDLQTPEMWKPKPSTKIEFSGLCVMHGGPRAMYLPEHAHVETQIQTRFCLSADRSEMEPHASSLYAPGQPHTGGIEENWEVLVMLLDPAFMARTADELFSRDRFEVKPFGLQRLPMVEHLSNVARREFHSPYGPSLFFMESIGHVMSGYILRHHAATAPLRALRGKFSSDQLHRIEEFIDERLGADFSVDDLSSFMKLGPQRFTERFRLTTGISPWQYVQARRVKRAKQLLADRSTSLAEIALLLGFSSQSHFTNVFRHAIGLTPAEYRNSTS